MTPAISQQGQLSKMTVSHPAATAVVFPHGAHLAEWTPAGQKPVLFMSPNSQFAPMKPIRGGVPVCLPWFGPHASNAALPAHGFARLLEWKLVDSSETADGATVRLQLSSDQAPEAMRQGEFLADLTLTLGQTLTMSLAVHNTGASPLTFEEALHTYFAVSDVRQISVAGLKGVDYISKAEGGVRKTDTADAIRFAGETDRVYLNTTGTCTIDDPGLDRRIVIAKGGSNNTVVWNPFPKRATELTDIGPENWPGFVCVETANVGDNRVALAAGARHEMTATISVQSR